MTQAATTYLGFSPRGHVATVTTGWADPAGICRVVARGLMNSLHCMRHPINTQLSGAKGAPLPPPHTYSKGGLFMTQIPLEKVAENQPWQEGGKVARLSVYPVHPAGTRGSQSWLSCPGSPQGLDPTWCPCCPGGVCSCPLCLYLQLGKCGNRRLCRPGRAVTWQARPRIHRLLLSPMEYRCHSPTWHPAAGGRLRLEAGKQPAGRAELSTALLLPLMSS